MNNTATLAGALVISAGALVTVGGFNGFAMSFESEPDTASLSGTYSDFYPSDGNETIVAIVVDTGPFSQSVSTETPNSPLSGYPPGLWGVVKPLRHFFHTKDDHLHAL